MKCEYCNEELKTGTMLCTDNDWRINDNSGSLKMIVEIHDIEDGSDEIGDTYSKEYCECGKFIRIISFTELAYTESDAINFYFPTDNTKTITDLINVVKTERSLNDVDAKIFIKEHFTLVKEWSF